jgi:two-component system, NarL family, invasion response regulator UvrY
MEDQQLIHIAYAEDHVSVRKGIVSVLHAMGDIHVDIEADNAVDMLDQLVTAARLPDICMIDINMPQMDGFSLLIEIKKRWPDMRTLILTLFNREPYIIQMIKFGANGYLLKNCDPSEIKRALLSIYHTGYYYSHVANSILFESVLNNEVKLTSFTDAEKEFMKHCCSNLSYDEIAEAMNTTSRSVKGYRDRLFNKLDVNSRVELALYAIQSGIVPLEIPNHINNKQ